MKKNNFQLNIKSILKKGNQFLKLVLGFIKIIKDLAQNFLSDILKKIKDIFLFFLGIFVWLPIQIKKFIVFLLNQGGNIWGNIRKPFYTTLGILIAIFCIFLAIFFILVVMGHINPTFIKVLNYQYILGHSTEYDSKTTVMLNTLIAQGKIISASDIYNHMLEYYNTLITILISLLGIFGFISWVSLQAKVKHEAELSVDNKFENKDFQCRLEKEVENIASEILNENNYISKIAEENVDLIIGRLLCSYNFITKIKEIIQNTKDDNNIELKLLKGVEDGDKIQ